MHRCCAHHERSASCTPNLYVYTLPEAYRDVDDLSPGRGVGSELLSPSETCLKCARCNFISVSRPYSDCSWFEECDLSNLESAPHHHSMRVNRTAAAPSAPS